jgi:diguanylate cyclase (GGDEF)-like protein/PAS domain S-box-containing protein
MGSRGKPSFGPSDTAAVAREVLGGALAVLVCRSDGAITYANPAASTLLGADPVGKMLPDVMAGESPHPLRETGLIVRQFRRADGTEFRAFVLVSESRYGQIIHFAEADAYIRERDRLAYQETIWRYAIEAGGHAVWDYNTDNEALFYSEEWKAMRGFPPGAEVQDSFEAWQERLHPDDRERMVEHVRQQNCGEIDHFNMEYRERRLDGRWIWVLARGKTVEWDEEGRPTRVVGTDIDITRLKEEEERRAIEAQAAYQRHLAELERANQAAEQARRAAHALARLDPLSNLANRRAFSEEIEHLSADSDGGMFAVLLLDLDRFKPVNDMHGHAVGDLVIRECAERLAAAVGAEGMVARLGGDEFGVILIGGETGIGPAAAICARHLIAELSRPMLIGDLSIEIGASVGFALFPEHSSDADSLFRYADMALYQAKQTARGTWSAYDRTMSRTAEIRAELETAVRDAVAREDIQPFFQPIVDMRSGRIVKLEVLARWQHPTHGAVPPDRFIPIIEQLGLMSAFTLSMLRRSCMAGRSWPADISISINLSTREVCDPATPLRLLATAVECAFPTTRLEIEITEKELVKDFVAAKQVISALRGAGVKVLLDDFGAGYSGLGYLREIAFDCIKIDRSFISMLTTRVESRKVTKAIQKLAQSLELATVAEGIEDEAVWEAVSRIGCTYGQGYYFSRPVPASEVPALLRRDPRVLRRAG